MVDYLIGSSSKMGFEKKILKRIEDIENLPEEEKKKVYELIDMALAYNKTKKVFNT